MPKSCQQKTSASGCPLDTPSLPFPSGRYSALSLLPAKGATAVLSAQGNMYRSFQSTHPRGVRRTAFPCAPHNPRFQSTHPRGVRLNSDANFNLIDIVSIHAPARGATFIFHPFINNYSVSIHAPARGATPGIDMVIPGMAVSIHAPARGATAPLPSPLNRAFERQNARTSAFWAFFHAVFLKQTVFSLFFSQLPLRGSHWETSVSLRFPFFRFCSFLLSRGAVFQNTSGPSGSIAVLAPTCSSRFFQLAPRK